MRHQRGLKHLYQPSIMLNSFQSMLEIKQQHSMLHGLVVQDHVAGETGTVALVWGSSEHLKHWRVFVRPRARVLFTSLLFETPFSHAALYTLIAVNLCMVCCCPMYRVAADKQWFLLRELIDPMLQEKINCLISILLDLVSACPVASPRSVCLISSLPFLLPPNSNILPVLSPSLFI